MGKRSFGEVKSLNIKLWRLAGKGSQCGRRFFNEMGTTEIWRRQVFRHPAGIVMEKTPAVRLEMRGGQTNDGQIRTVMSCPW